MVEERRLAVEKNYASPVWDSLEETHSCYNSNAKLLIDNLKNGDALIVASHNVGTVAMVQDMMKLVANNDERVRFGQLKAFSD